MQAKQTLYSNGKTYFQPLRKLPGLLSLLFCGLLLTMSISAETFPGSGAGTIPDGGTGTPPNYGTPLVISFNVNNMDAPLNIVQVDITMTHTWVGDVDMVLTAPDNTTNQPHSRKQDRSLNTIAKQR